MTSPRVEVDADLRVEVVGPDGSTANAHVTGHGDRLHVGLDRPDVIGAELGRRDFAAVAQLLADVGVTVEVTGPRGPVATVGAGARSRLGSVLVGSDRVAMGRGADARQVLRTLVTPSTRRVLAALGGVVVLLGVAGRHRIRAALGAPSRRG